MVVLAKDLQAAPRRRAPSPLRSPFYVSRRAYDLAGGHEPMLDLFASRLRGFYRERGEAFEVVCDFCIWTTDTSGAIGQGFSLFRPRDLRPPMNVEAQLETWDSGRCIYPGQFQLTLPADDPLLRLHNALAKLIAAWPERAQQACAA